MKIKSLHLENFRCFENFDLDFDERLTVLVGMNGTGKTATLDALIHFFVYAGNQQLRSSIDLFIIPLSDASINAKSDTITYNIRLAWPSTYDGLPDELNFIFKRRADHYSYFSLIQSDMPTMIAKWENVYHALETENPLFAAYMAGRFIAEDAHIPQNASTALSQTAAFDNAFNRTGVVA
ncbi:MAG: AAA family ATPase [Desulfovibrio sp.]|jgi:hypothetical protein|nr:AAA family ATPase [Desulfovibrio sp.]